MIITQAQSTPFSVITWGDLAMVEGQRDRKFARNGKLSHSCARVMNCKFPESLVQDLDRVVMKI